MKRVLFLLVVFVFVSSSIFAQRTIQEKISNFALQSDLENRSLNAHDDAVFDVVLNVSSRFNNQVQNEDTVINKDCSAVRIDSNWLIASLYCRGVSSVAVGYDHNGEGYQKTVAYRNINYIKVEGIKVYSDNFYVNENAKVILIRINEQELSKELSGNTIANLLIPGNPASLLKAVNKAYINRERYCLPGRCSDEVGIDQYCDGNKCFKVEWELIDGDSGDPLFMLSKKHGKAEFLVGLNAAENSSGYETSGRNYHVLNDAVYAFMKEIIGKKDVGAWERIYSHVLNEKKF